MHPIAFNLGSWPVHWYGIMVALGFLTGLWTAGRRGVSGGVPLEKVIDLGPWLIVGAILGARTLYVLSYWREQFADLPFWEIFAIWRGGLVFYGGLVGSSIACIVYARTKNIPLWKLGDIFAPSVALGHAFGRIGCLLNGCCYGRACELPWGIRFPEGNALGAPTTPVHPTQVYESILDFLLSFGLAWLYRRRKFDGQVFATYLVCYALLRSFVEMFRGDYLPQQYFGGWITPAHLVSIVTLLTGVVLFMVLSRPARQSS